MTNRLNIISIICHDLGRELGCYGRPVVSPNLDRFAAESVRFAKVHCNAVACTPARVSLMTGSHAHQAGVLGLAHQGWPLPDDQVTMVDAFNQAGYETAHTGHQHERMDPARNRYQVELRKERADDLSENAVDAAIGYLRDRTDSSTPFYLNIGLREVHASLWDPPDAQPRTVYEPFRPQRVPETPGITEADGQHALNFHSAIGYMDQQFGRLLNALYELACFDNTLIVFTTDHGRHLGPRSKGTLYELGTEVSLIVRMPKADHGGNVHHGLNQHIDLMPTLLEAAGCPLPPHVTGRSLWPQLQSNTDRGHEMIFMERTYHGGPSSPDYYLPARACRTPRYLYLRYFDRQEQTLAMDCRELYDIMRDPLARNNIVEEPMLGDVVESLDAHLMQWMEDANDPLLHGHVPDPLN